MLPFDVPWYRRLLRFAILLGIAGGILGLIYIYGTGWVIDRVFPESDGAVWSGEWWWILLTAFGGFIVVLLRTMWHVPDNVPGGVALIEAADVDHTTAPQWVVLAVISAITGASLGPSFALVVMGGGLGSWIASRRWAEGGADQDYTLTGIAGAFGGAFTSPILGAFLVSELEPLPRNRYVASIIPQLIASMIAFIIFYAVAGRTFLGSYDTPPYEFEIGDILIAMGLGVLSAFLMMVFVGIILGVRWVCALVPNRYVLGIVGGALVGLIALALPLTVGAGQSQLGVAIDNSAALGIGLLVLVLFAKMVAMSLSLEVGFLGGNVFPMIFMGGTAGTIVHLAFPDIPLALAVGCMLAALPGSYLRAPISLVFIAAIALYLNAEAIAPVAVAVITAYLLVAGVRYVVSNRRAAAGETQPAGNASG
ncbi:MAG: chloride channel protein [Acidimicrobiia bacterium]